MPLPLIAVAIWELIVWVVGWVIANPLMASMIATGAATFAEVDTGEFMRRARNMVAAVINSVSPFNLEGGDFESSQRFKAALAREVAGQSGIAIRDITDKDMLREDLELHALGLIEARTGYRLSSLSNVEALKGDLLGIGVGLVGERTGIHLTDVTNVETIKADLLDWGKDQIMISIAADLETAVNAEYANGVSLLSMMKQATGRDVKATELLSGLQAVTMQRYAERNDVVQVITKADRRRLQNKINQQKFRERHKKGSPHYDGGGIQVYIPKGWKCTATRR